MYFRKCDDMSDYVLYSNVETHETYLEIWGASTKHPDERFRFSDWLENEISEQYRHFYNFNNAWIQWLSYIASIQTFPHTTRRMLLWLTDIIRYRDKKDLDTTL